MHWACHADGDAPSCREETRRHAGQPMRSALHHLDRYSDREKHHSPARNANNSSGKTGHADALASCARDQVRASLGAPPSAFQADRSSESEKERAKGGRCHLICSAETTCGCVPQAGSLGSLSVRPQHGTWDDGPNERQDHAHRSCALCAHGTGRGALGRSSVFSFQRQCPQI